MRFTVFAIIRIPTAPSFALLGAYLFGSIRSRLIALGAILSGPEEPETRLIRRDAKEIDPEYILDESAAVQRTIQAEVSNDDIILLKIAQPFLGVGLSVDGKFSKDKKTVVDALDVKAKIFFTG